MIDFRRMAAILVSILPVGLFTAEPARADRVVLDNGEVVIGEITQETEESVSIADSTGTWTFSRKRITGIERQGKARTHLELGKTYLKENSLERAIEHLELARQLAPDDQETRSALAQALTQKAGRLLEARRFQSARNSAAAARSLAASQELDALLRRADDGLKGAARMAAAVTKNARSGDLDAARLGYYELFNFSPAHREELGPQMAELLVAIGNRLVKDERHALAADAFSEAITFDPKVAGGVEQMLVWCRINQINYFLESNQPLEAMTLLEGLLAVVPQNAVVNYYLGVLVEATRGDSAAAAPYYAAAAGQTIEGRPDAGQIEAIKEAAKKRLGIKPGTDRVTAQPVRAKWDEVESVDFQVYETERFKIYHRNGSLAQELGRAAELQYRQVIQRWPPKDGKEAQGKIEIYVYKDADEYARKTAQAPWSGGFNRVTAVGAAVARREIHTHQTANGLLDGILPHEITHVLFAESVGVSARLPLWLNEGIAVMAEPPYKWSYYDNLIRARLTAGDQIPLGKLMAMEAYPDDERSVHLFYAESFSVARFLIQKAGPDAVIRYCRLLGEGKGESAGFEAFGFLRPADLEAAWAG